MLSQQQSNLADVENREQYIIKQMVMSLFYQWH